MRFIPAKTILSAYESGNAWFGKNYNMNIYKGCCHGCIYCDSRSDCYQIDNFDEVRAKDHALAMLNSELAAKRRTGVIGTGAMSDPYNPCEKEYCLTRGALELINARRFGIAIATKSDLIARDTDVLSAIREHSPVLVKITVTTADDNLCKLIEPHVAPASQRYAAISSLTGQGICTGILLMPVLPFLGDTEQNIRAIIRLARESGAAFIYPAFGVTLRQSQREWYYKKLDEHFPGLRQKYVQAFGNAYECRSPNAKALWTVFQTECEKAGILFEMKDIIAYYKKGYEDKQLVLF